MPRLRRPGGPDARPRRRPRRTQRLDGARAVISYAVRARDPEQFLDAARDPRARRLPPAPHRGARRRAPLDMRDLDRCARARPWPRARRVEVVVDRLALAARDERRVQQAIESAWERGGGRAEVHTEAGQHRALVRGLVCPTCARTFEPPRPGLFSYNSPLGACAACRGFGRIIAVDWDKVIPDWDKTLAKGAIKAVDRQERRVGARAARQVLQAAEDPDDVPWGELTAEQRAAVIEGEGSWKAGKFPGVRAWFSGSRRAPTRCTCASSSRATASTTRARRARARASTRPRSRTASAGRTSPSGTRLTVAEAHARDRGARGARRAGARRAAELRHAPRLPRRRRPRLPHARSPGAHALGRRGAARRARPRRSAPASRARSSCSTSPPWASTRRTCRAWRDAMRELSRAGNAVLVIEHDGTVVRSCDRVVELGPGAGAHGGRVLFDGTPVDARQSATDLPTGRASGRERATAARKPRTAKRLPCAPRRAREQPRRTSTCVSRSACSAPSPGRAARASRTLADDILYRAIARALGDTRVDRPGRVRLARRARAAARAPCSSIRRRSGAPRAATRRRTRRRGIAFARASPPSRRADRAGLAPSPLLVQRRGRRALRGVLGRGLRDRRDAVPRRRAARLRRLPGQALQARGARDRASTGKSVADVLAMTVDEALAAYDPARASATTCSRARSSPWPTSGSATCRSASRSRRSRAARRSASSSRARSPRRPRARSSCSTSRARVCTRVDVAHVLAALSRLVDERRERLVVEHDLDIVRAADWVDRSRPRRRPRRAGTSSPKARPTAHRDDDDAHGPRARPSAGRRARASTARRDARRSRRRRSSTSEHAREHNLKNVSCRIPHGKLVRRHRAERVGQVVARVRRRLRRGAAALPGDAHALRAAVPADAAAPRRRSRDRRSAAHRARAAHDARRRATRPSRRSPRSPTTCACSTRRSATCTARRATRPCRPSSPDELFARASTARAERDAASTRSTRPRCARARARTSTSSPRASRAGVHGRARRRRDRRRPIRRRSSRRRRSTTIDLIVYYGELAIARPRDVRSRARARARALRVAARARRAPGQERRAHALDGAHLLRVRHRRARARSALVLVQHEAGPVRGVRGHGRRAVAEDDEPSPSRATCAGHAALPDPARACASSARRYPSSSRAT